MKNICFAFLMLMHFNLIAQQQNNSNANSTSLSFKIIDSPNHTFGYDIYLDEKKIIHQPTPPGLSGNDGFRKKKDAEKVAQIVIQKIKKGEMPPTISPAELQKILQNK